MNNILYTNNKVAHVTGVLNKNNEIRNEHLNRNIGKYSQWKNELNPAIGEVYMIDYQRPFYSITNGESLLDYTHNVNSVYSNMINSIYFPKNREKEIIGFETLSPDKVQSWAGKYVNYVTYMDEVFGEDVYSRHVRYINDLLSGQYIENALRQTEVNTIRPMVSIAKQGIITTNTQNTSGIDTTMGTISNYMYSTLLYNGAIFNSDRKSNEKYLTPSLFNQYGNNLSNVEKLADLLTVGTGKKRLTDDLGADINIIHNPTDSFDIRTLNINDLTNLYDDASKYVASNYVGYNGFLRYGETYVNFTKNKGDKRFLIDTKNVNKSSKFLKPNKINSITTLDTYDEKDILGTNDSTSNLNNEENDFNNFEPINNENGNGLLDKTAQLFNEHKINTLIGRFHTSKDNQDDDSFGMPEFIDTAKNKGYGNSHGRNLLKRNPSKDSIINGYDNPYCRVWTYHHQYNQVKKLIRPFLGDNNSDEPVSIKTLQGKLKNFRTVKTNSDSTSYDGGDYLAQNTVLGDNGFVNICPKVDDDINNIKKYMFSIENLAWKDVENNEKYLSKEQRGPNGGRIMWFPPYNLSFSESVNVSWSDNDFIGRGEKVYTYNNTVRNGNLDFLLLIDHPSIIHNYTKLDDSNLKLLGAENDDVDAEILRFFAGCQMPDFFDIEEDEKPKEQEKPKEIVKPRVEHIKFYVYFPNNYTGSFNEKNDYSVIDNDWWEYILYGYYTSLYSSSEKWYGYECKKDKSICPLNSSDVPNDIKNSWIKCCANAKINNPCENDYSKADKTTGAYCWQYRVDNDLRQILPNLRIDGSYKDDHSYQLNTVLNSEYHKDATCTFGEFIYALLKLKKIEFVKLPLDNEKYTLDDLEQKLLNDGCDINNINKLLSIFSEKDVKLIKANIQGSADENDSSNSLELAKRRSNTLKEFFINVFDKKDFKVYIKESMPLVGGKKGQNASSLINKRSRCVLVDIEYQLKDQVINLSDGTSGDDNSDKTESGATNEMLFDEWYKALSSGSTIIQAYESVINNDEYEKDYGAFQFALKEWLDEQKISYNISDYTKDDDWFDVVDKICNNYGYNYLINSYAFKKENLQALINKVSSDEYSTYYNYFLSKKNQMKTEQDSLSTEKESKNKKKKKITKDIDDLTKKITKIGGKNCNCDFLSLKNDICDDCKGGKIGDIQGEIISILMSNNYLEDELKNYEKDLNDKQYKLDHWSVKLGDKLEIKLEINNLEREISKIKGDIEKNNKLIERKRSEIDDLKSDLGKLLEKRDKLYYEIYNIDAEISNIENKIKEIGSQITDGSYSDIREDLATLYYYYMSIYPDSIDYRTYMGSDELVKDGEQIGNSLIEVYKPLEETDDMYEYEEEGEIKFTNENLNDYKKFNEKLFFEEDKEYNLSFYQVLKDYFLIDYLKEIKEGLDFGFVYLFNNYKDKFSFLRDIRFIYALINGYKETDFEDFEEEGSTQICDKCHFYKIKNKLENIKKLIYKNDVFTNYDYLLSGINKLVSYTSSSAAIKGNVKDAYTLYESLIKFLETTSSDILNDINSYISEELQKAKDNLKAKADMKNKVILNKKNKDAEKAKLAEDKANLQRMREKYFAKKKDNGINRYETESEYFNRIKLEDPLVFKSIRDKFKYFNPAFHSISPEGFNARLNFLQQCTRQGPTCEIGSGINGKSANNLAFGRMPVCVLRIGDFIHTKIIITSVSIQYDANGGIQYDLNPEGIGVQPMYAKVSLGITIIGGQSLKAPINRLQNAISFNYYANTGVYDDRSDIVDYNGNEIVYKRVFNPSMQDVNKNNESVKTNVNKKLDSVDVQKENYADLSFENGKTFQRLENMKK